MNTAQRYTTALTTEAKEDWVLVQTSEDLNAWIKKHQPWLANLTTDFTPIINAFNQKLKSLDAFMNKVIGKETKVRLKDKPRNRDEFLQFMKDRKVEYMNCKATTEFKDYVREKLYKDIPDEKFEELYVAEILGSQDKIKELIDEIREKNYENWRKKLEDTYKWLDVKELEQNVVFFNLDC